MKNAEDLEIMDRQLASEQKRIMELEKELEDLRFIYSTMNGKRIRYKKALEFYADKNTWYQKHIKENEYEAPVALKDEGRIARQVLEGKE